MKAMAEAKEKNPRARAALPPSPDWVTMRDVAAYTRHGISTVCEGVKNRTWPFTYLRRIKIGNRVLFTRASFEAMRRAMLKAVEEVPEGDVVSIGEGRREVA